MDQKQQSQQSRSKSPVKGKGGMTLTKLQSLLIQMTLFLGLIYFGLEAWLGTGPEMKSLGGVLCYAPGADWLSYLLVAVVTAFFFTTLMVVQNKD